MSDMNDRDLERGPKGDHGQHGDTGKTGEPGVAGERGATGVAGERGPIGDIGTQGVQGDIGTQGAQGKPGAQGQQGKRGMQFGGWSAARLVAFIVVAAAAIFSSARTFELTEENRVALEQIKAEGAERRHQICLSAEREHLSAVTRLERTYAYLKSLNAR